MRVTSRQIIYLMSEFLKPQMRGEDIYDMKDLLAVELGASHTKCSLAELEEFLLRWDTVITGMNNSVSDEMLFTLLYKQVRYIEHLDFDMKGFDRLPIPEQTYDKLYRICLRMIAIQREADNQRKVHGKLRQNPIHVSAAATDDTRGRRSSSPGGRGRSPGRSYSAGKRPGSFHKSRSTSPGGRPKPGFVRKTSQGRKSLSRDKLCIDFIKGKCTRGAGCKYSHNKDGKRSPGRSDRSPPRDGRRPTTPPPVKKYPCKLFAAGNCKYGDKCIFIHGNPSAAGVSVPETPSPVRSSNSPAPESGFR